MGSSQKVCSLPALRDDFAARCKVKYLHCSGLTPRMTRLNGRRCAYCRWCAWEKRKDRARKKPISVFTLTYMKMVVPSDGVITMLPPSSCCKSDAWGQEWGVRKVHSGEEWKCVRKRKGKKGEVAKKEGKKQPRCDLLHDHSRSGPKLGKGVGGGLLVSVVRSRNAHLYACAVDGSNGCCSENQSEGSHVQVWVVTNLFFLECRGQVFRDVGDIAKGI